MYKNPKFKIREILVFNPQWLIKFSGHEGADFSRRS